LRIQEPALKAAKIAGLGTFPTIDGASIDDCIKKVYTEKAG
jgi:hypothetical protein